MKMVKSCSAFYAITFLSVIISGTSFASLSPPMGQNHRRDIEIHPVTTNGSSADGFITGKHNGSFQKPETLQTSHLPTNHQSVGQFNTTQPYFALFDPVSNVTAKFGFSQRNALPNNRHWDNDDPLFAINFNGENAKRTSDFARSGRKDGREKIKNFIEWDTLRDSEKEVRVHYNGITAKETVVRTGADEETGKRQGLKLRQLTDGTHFIQLVYNFDNEIQDCEYIRQKEAIEKFLRSFRDNVENAKEVYENSLEENLEGEEDDDEYLEDDEGKIERYSLESEQFEGEDADFGQEYRNVSFQIIRSDSDLPKELSEWMNYRRLKRECRENHKILKQLAFNRKHGDELAKKLAEEHIERVKRNLDFSLIFPGTKWCGKSNIAEKYTALGGFSKTDKCCRSHDHCHPLISAFEEKYGFYNFRPFTVSHCRCDSRRKRGIMDVLLVPGTKWCGKGRRATKYTSLGGFSRTDKCCRVHDTMCPHWIGSLEEKYGLFNWRINTIMHCRCDKRFRACLKMAKTGTANFVGKLFFNVVQTKCFVLKPQKVCLKYSWWGNSCEKMEYRKKAYLKDNLSY